MKSTPPPVAFNHIKDFTLIVSNIVTAMPIASIDFPNRGQDDVGFNANPATDSRLSKIFY
jgi:hypothetical protein